MGLLLLRFYFVTWWCYLIPGTRCPAVFVVDFERLPGILVTKFVLVKRCGAVRWGVWCGVERYCAIIFFAVNAIAIHEVILNR